MAAEHQHKIGHFVQFIPRNSVTFSEFSPLANTTLVVRNSDHVTLALWLGTVRHTLHGRVYYGISPGDLFHSNSFAISASLMEVYALAECHYGIATAFIVNAQTLNKK